MGVESATFINDFDSSLPTATDLRSQGDDHLRLVKTVLKATLPGSTRAWRIPRFASKAVNYSIVLADDETIFLVDTSAGNVTMTLPAVPATAWKVTIIKVTADANQVVISGTVNGGSLTNLKSLSELYTIGGNGTLYYDLSNVVRNSSVTYAKMQNVSATSRLLGRSTAGAGVVEEISLAAGLSIVAGVLTPASTNPAPSVPNYLSGLILSTAGGSATMSISAGAANDSTNAQLMILAAISKTTASWAVGSGNGGLDTGAIAPSTWYHFFEIYRPDTGVTDVLFSLSPSAPTLPASYTLFRRLGSGKTTGASQWTAFSQFGDEFLLSTPVLDSATGALGTAASTVTLPSVPTGVQVLARILGNHSNAVIADILITSLDVAATAVNTPGGNSTSRNPVSGQSQTWPLQYVRTNTSAQIRTIASQASTTLNIVTTGWIDSRGKQ
jgi:hypothetical protein